jgi:hypothetical protein
VLGFCVAGQVAELFAVASGVPAGEKRRRPCGTGGLSDTGKKIGTNTGGRYLLA